MKLYTYKYNGTEFEFTITRAARSKISDMQFDIFDELQNPEIFEVMNKVSGLQIQLKDAKDNSETELAESIEAQINMLSIEMMPKMKDFIKLQQNSIDADKVAIILLKENKKYKDTMTDELAENILDDMVETLGMDKYDEIMVGIVDKVFTLIQLLRDNLDGVAKKTSKEKMDKEKLNTVPMS